MLTILISAAAWSQTVNNIDDSSTGWNYCWSGGVGTHHCTPGGSGSVTLGPTQTFVNPVPSLDGNSALFGFTGTAFTDVLFYWQGGANNTAVQFTADYWVKVTGTVQDAEFDTYQYLHSTLDLINWGTQCQTGGKWQIWQGDNSTWHNTTIACNPLTTVFHHIILVVHRIPGDTICNGHPMMYYDSLTIDGTVNNLNIAYCSTVLPGSFVDQTGLNFQLDTNSSGGAVSENIDEVTFKASTVASNVPFTMWGTSWNGISATPPPPIWPPTDSNSHVVPVTNARMWDDGVKWSQVETSAGTYVWTKLDEFVRNLAPTTNPPMQIIYTVGSTPKWAGTCASAPDPSTCLPGSTTPTVLATNGTINSGSANLSSASNPFSATNNGAIITVSGAGPGGTTLTSTQLSFTNPGHIVLSTFASTTVTGTATVSLGGFGGGTQCASSDYTCLPPSDVASDGSGTDAQYQAFMSTLVARYTGQIKYYENWNEEDSPNFWCPGANGASGCPVTTAGAFAIAVRMNWDQWNIVHCLDPHAMVLSPSFHGFSSGAGAWMNLYSNTSISAPAGNIAGCVWGAQTVTGKQTFDITNFHNHSASAENLVSSYNGMVGEINRDSLSNIVFMDELGCNGIGQCINQDTLASYVARTYALCASFTTPSVVECNYYQWDSNGVQLQGTISGLAFNVVEGWLTNAQVSNFTLTTNTYTIPVITANGTTALLAWDVSKNCNSGCTTGNQVFGAAYQTYQDITGTTFSTIGGNGTAPVGLKPILLLQAGVPPTPPTNLQVTPGVRFTKGVLIN